jgi:hypothetical protein
MSCLTILVPKDDEILLTSGKALLSSSVLAGNLQQIDRPVSSTPRPRPANSLTELN